MIACVGLVLASQNTPKENKETKKQLMYYHKSFGALAFILLFPRILIKITSKSPQEMPAIFGAPSLEHLLAKAGHLALYGLAFVLPVSGMIMTYAGTDRSNDKQHPII
jgi:cytochrome b561